MYWEDYLQVCIQIKALRAVCTDASIFGCDCLPFFVGSRDIWFEYDTNSQNAAYQWELKVEILQGGLGKAVGHKRYLAELADVWQDGFKKCAVWSVVGVCFRCSGVLFQSLLWCNFSLVVFILFPDRSRKHWEFQRWKLKILLSGLLVWIYGIKWCTTSMWGFFLHFHSLRYKGKEGDFATVTRVNTFSRFFVSFLHKWVYVLSYFPKFYCLRNRNVPPAFRVCTETETDQILLGCGFSRCDLAQTERARSGVCLFDGYIILCSL